MSPFNPFRRKRPTGEGAEQPAPEPAPEQAAEGPSLFGKLRSGLAKTRQKVTGGLLNVLSIRRALDDQVIEEIEEQLYVADVGPRTVARLCDELRAAHRDGGIAQSEEVAG